MSDGSGGLSFGMKFGKNLWPNHSLIVHFNMISLDFCISLSNIDEATVAADHLTPHVADTIPVLAQSEGLNLEHHGQLLFHPTGSVPSDASSLGQHIIDSASKSTSSIPPTQTPGPPTNITPSKRIISANQTNTEISIDTISKRIHTPNSLHSQGRIINCSNWCRRYTTNEDLSHRNDRNPSQRHSTRDSESTIPRDPESTIPRDPESMNPRDPESMNPRDPESTIPTQSTSQHPYNQSDTTQGGNFNARIQFHQFNPTLAHTAAHSGPQAFGWHPQQLPAYPVSMELGPTYPHIPAFQTNPISHPQGSGPPFILLPPPSNFNPYTGNMLAPPSTTSETLEIGNPTRRTTFNTARSTENSSDPSRTSTQQHQPSTSARHQSSSASRHSLEVPQPIPQRSRSPTHSLTEGQSSQLFRNSSRSPSSSSHSSRAMRSSSRRHRSTQASAKASTSRRSPSSSPQPSDVSSSEESDESDSSPESDLDIHQRQHHQRKLAQSRAKITKSRHDGIRFEKLTEDQGPSKNEQLSICIQDYCKLLLGVTRKIRGQKSTSKLPSPPSEKEITEWEKRKNDRKLSIKERVKKERERFLKAKID
ncbi:uncharacterized protein MELLADRAFT_69806 [Melampsora larici-populina 98AG31]|uniref:Uncharacterized protein n=1 Tax=Melampsora larici-populina (strain 98AG31 / pathotype 3-4-7) TaxID=747676 RepID=F4SC89_MELLP|nr:uncharacterized protein MELLADRAFT_69806 [Melampsora larici-populina 98AG31]EGF97744.1 hypothetical protein MELLADRAFT_69806 [Melampsora larici-populina 98AG31]